MPGKRLKASAHRSPGRRSGPQATTELFHALVEYSSDAVALLDETGAITYVSQAATRLLGYGVPELTGTNAMGFLHPDDLALTQRLCRQLLDQPGTPFRTELRARHKDGSYHLVEAVAVNRLDDPAVRARCSASPPTSPTASARKPPSAIPRRATAASWTACAT